MFHVSDRWSRTYRSASCEPGFLALKWPSAFGVGTAAVRHNEGRWRNCSPKASVAQI